MIIENRANIIRGRVIRGKIIETRGNIIRGTYSGEIQLRNRGA